MKNIYYEDNKNYFQELKILVENTSMKYIPALLKHSKKHLGKWINSFELFNDHEIKWNTKIYCILNNIQQFPKCLNANCNCILKNIISIDTGFRQYCSLQCTNTSEMHKKHAEQTCLERYGNKNFGHGKLAEEKTEQTCLERYGKKHYNNPEKIKRTVLQKYNVINISQLKTIKEKKVETCKKHYGVDYPSQSSKLQEKTKQTNLEVYGYEYPTQSNKIQQKIISTCNKRYGCDRPAQSHIVRQKMRSNYLYDNIKFSTLPEVAYYIWLKDNNIQFEYQPNEPKLTYEVNGKIHRYFPDFKIGKQLVEIKGPHLVDENGIWTAPRSSNMTDQEYQNKLLCLRQKQLCALKHNVHIVYIDEYQQYIDYVSNNYGKNFLKGLKLQYDNRKK